MFSKFTMVVDDAVTKSYVLFPNMLFAYAVIINYHTVSFVWPFIFGYSMGQITPFLLSPQKAKDSWQGNYHLLAILAFIGSIIVALGITFRLEWLMSIGACGLSFGVTGLATLSDHYQGKPAFSQMHLMAAWLIVLLLLLIGYLALKVNLIWASLLYAIVLLLEVAYSIMFGTKRHLVHFFIPERPALVLATSVFTTAFIISLFKKTGYLASFSWVIIALAVFSILITIRQYLSLPFRAFSIWIGAINNYLIIYSLIFSFQQHQPTWIFVMFIELSLSGWVAQCISKPLKSTSLTFRFYGSLLLLFGSLLLIVNASSYLWGIGIIFVALRLLSSCSELVGPQKKIGVSIKLKVIGSMWCQIVLFAIFELLANLQLKNRAALILPFVHHQAAVQYDPEMTLIRFIMAVIFIISGMIIVVVDHRKLKN